MGDLHQPLHTGRGNDKGGNEIQGRWFGKGSNLHRVWDSEMIDDFQMSFTELAENTDKLSKSELNRIKAGTLLDLDDYDSAEIGAKLGYEYMYHWFPMVHEQVQKGGIRLAKVLNEIFS